MDMDLLKARIEESGYRFDYVANQIGMSRHGLYNKIRNPGSWKVSEMAAIIKLLSLNRADSKRIFGN